MLQLVGGIQYRGSCFFFFFLECLKVTMMDLDRELSRDVAEDFSSFEWMGLE